MMETTFQLNTSISLSRLAKLLREQLPVQARHELAAMIQADDDAPTKEQILTQLKEDYIALQKGTLKTRPATEFLAELKTEGYL